jgi:hypothetical protein
VHDLAAFVSAEKDAHADVIAKKQQRLDGEEAVASDVEFPGSECAHRVQAAAPASLLRVVQLPGRG